MKTIQLVISLISLMTLAMLSGCSDGSTGTPGNAKTSLKVVFGTTSSASAATTLQSLGISRLTLDVIPVNSGSYQPPRIDLYAAAQGSATMGYTITNLTDNETYLFRILAYDAGGKYVYGGQSSTVMQPAPATNSISVYAWYFNGFSAVAGQEYAFTASTGGSGIITLSADGTGSGTSTTGATLICYLVPSSSGFSVFEKSSAGDHGSGTLDPASGTGSGSGVNVSGQAFTWTVARYHVDFSAAVGSYSGSTSGNVGLTCAIDASGAVSGSSTNGYTIKGSLTPSGASNTIFSFAGTSTSGTDVATLQGTLTTTTGILSGTYTSTLGGSGTWSVTKVTSSSTTQALLQSGNYDTKHAGYMGTTAYMDVYAARFMKLASDGVSLTEAYTYRDPTSKAWSSTAPSGMPATLFSSTDYFLTSGGWVAAPSGPQNHTATLNSDGSVTVTNKTDGSRLTLTATATDVSGQTIGAMGGIMSNWPLVTTSTFPTGSTRYNMSWTSLDDSYSLWPGGYVDPAVTSLSQIPTVMQSFEVDKETNQSDYGYYGMYVSGTSTVDIYQYSTSGGTASVKIGSGSYALTTVKGQQILEITIPDTLRTQYRLGGNPIYGTANGVIYAGTHNLPGAAYFNNTVSWNSTAIQFLESSFK